MPKPWYNCVTKSTLQPWRQNDVPATWRNPEWRHKEKTMFMSQDKTQIAAIMAKSCYSSMAKCHGSLIWKTWWRQIRKFTMLPCYMKLINVMRQKLCSSHTEGVLRNSHRCYRNSIIIMQQIPYPIPNGGHKKAPDDSNLGAKGDKTVQDQFCATI